MRARRMHAIRGATTVAADEADAIVAATRDLLLHLATRNDVVPDDVVSVIFSVTPDLSSAFPARAARELGWVDAPLLCTTEIAVPGALPRCVRVLMHVEFAEPRSAVRHVYLNGAEALRPEWASEPAARASVVPLAAPVAPTGGTRAWGGARRNNGHVR